MCLIISGTSGFIGRRLLAELDEGNIAYTKLFRDPYDNSLSVENVSKHIGSTYIHLAGLAHQSGGFLSYEDYDNANRKIILDAVPKLLDIGVSKIIYVSSIGVYGKNSYRHGEIYEDMTCEPVEAYARSKYRAEKDLLELSKKLNFKLIILRPSLVYGSGAPGNINRLIRLFNYCPIVIFGCRKNKRTFLDIDFLVDVIIKVSFIEIDGAHIFNIADEKAMSCSMFYSELSEKNCKRIFIINLPRRMWYLLLSLTGKKKLFDQLFGDFVVNSKKIRDLISEFDAKRHYDS